MVGKAADLTAVSVSAESADQRCSYYFPSEGGFASSELCHA